MAEVVDQWFGDALLTLLLEEFLSIRLNILSHDLASFVSTELTIFHSEDLSVSLQGGRISVHNKENTVRKSCFWLLCVVFNDIFCTKSIKKV